MIGNAGNAGLSAKNWVVACELEFVVYTRNVTLTGLWLVGPYIEESSEPSMLEWDRCEEGSEEGIRFWVLRPSLLVFASTVGYAHGYRM